MVKTCSYANCNSDTRYSQRESMKGVTFYRFPGKRGEWERCKKWIHACGVKTLTTATRGSTSSRFICSLHFYGRKGPTPLHPDPISATASALQKRLFANPRRTLVRKPLAIKDVPVIPSCEVDETPEVGGKSPEVEKNTSEVEKKTPEVKKKTPGVEDERREYEPVFVCSDNTRKYSKQRCNKGNAFMNDVPEVTQCDSLPTTSINHEPAKDIQYSWLNVLEEESTSNNDIFRIHLSDLHFRNVMACQWSIMADNNSATYSYLQHNIVQKCLKVDLLTGMFTTEVYGQAFVCENDANNYPTYVRNEDDIVRLIRDLGSMRACGGVDESPKTILEAVLKKNFSSTCGLFDFVNKSRCQNCQNYRSNQIRKHKQIVLEPSKHQKLAALKKKDLLAVAKAQRARDQLSKMQISRLKLKLQEHVAYRKMQSKHRDTLSEVLHLLVHD